MRFREPFNAWSHLVGLVLAAAGTGLLLHPGRYAEPVGRVHVYGGSLILSTPPARSITDSTSPPPASLAPHPGPYRDLLPDRRVVHAGVAADPGQRRWPDAAGRLLGHRGGGIPFKIRWLDAPVWLSTAIYLAMGYLALLAVVPIGRAVGASGLAWLIAGGLAYTVGAVIFALGAS